MSACFYSQFNFFESASHSLFIISSVVGLCFYMSSVLPAFKCFSCLVMVDDIRLIEEPPVAHEEERWSD